MLKLFLILFYIFLSSPSFAQQQCPLLFAPYRLVQGEKEVMVHLSRTFAYIDMNHDLRYEARLNHLGEITITSALVNEELGVKSAVSETDLFDKMISHFGVHQISAVAGIQNAHLAASYGFTQVEIFNFTQDDTEDSEDTARFMVHRPFHIRFVRPSAD